LSSEREKMLAGELYDPGAPELVEARRRCRALLLRLRNGEDVLHELLGHVGGSARVEPPFACDYGTNITLGANAFVNFNAVFLDCAAITIGERAQIGPGVQLLAADHPLDPDTRRQGLENAKPIDIGADAWIGGGAIVLPGVTIGDGAVVGAGSVVTRDVPRNTLALGNPARIVRSLA
jgi:maltose O-acetyltransferase